MIFRIYFHLRKFIQVFFGRNLEYCLGTFNYLRINEILSPNYDICDLVIIEQGSKEGVGNRHYIKKANMSNKRPHKISTVKYAYHRIRYSGKDTSNKTRLIEFTKKKNIGH